MIEYLSQKKVQEFIKEHQNDDPAQLMLSSESKNWKYFDKIVEQIQSRQKAKNKLPDWLEAEGLIWPPPLSIEQASSQITAEKKLDFIKSGGSMVDLTGGYGIDCYYLSKKFTNTTYVERAEELCQIASHNFEQLGSDIKIKNTQAEHFLEGTHRVDFIYLDPARRDLNAKKVFRLADCSPDVAAIQKSLLKKADQVLIKLSPLLDISSVLNELESVAKVYVVAVKNEVKELLVLLKMDFEGEPRICCVNMDQSGEDDFEFFRSEEQELNLPFSDVKRYLYEPNAAILKAGAFKSVGEQFQLFELHPNTHLYTSSSLKPGFPGRIFDVEQSLPLEHKKLKKSFPELKGNIATRNFPMSVEALRKKMKIKEGGEHYLFACTGQEGKLFLLTQKIKQNSHDERG